MNNSSMKQVAVMEVENEFIYISKSLLNDASFYFPMPARLIHPTDDTHAIVFPERGMVTQCFSVPEEYNFDVSTDTLLRYRVKNGMTLCLFDHREDETVTVTIEGESCWYVTKSFVNVDEFSKFLSKYNSGCTYGQPKVV